MMMMMMMTLPIMNHFASIPGAGPTIDNLARNQFNSDWLSSAAQIKWLIMK